MDFCSSIDCTVCCSNTVCEFPLCSLHLVDYVKKNVNKNLMYLVDTCTDSDSLEADHMKTRLQCHSFTVAFCILQNSMADVSP